MVPERLAMMSFKEGAMMSKNISQTLAEKPHFKQVSTLVETVGGQSKTIAKGTPLTWDANNGVTVIYDEDGYPWVTPGEAPVHGLRKGAYVPFSNDGGAGMRFLFPHLYRQR